MRELRGDRGRDMEREGDIGERRGDLERRESEKERERESRIRECMEDRRITPMP